MNSILISVLCILVGIFIFYTQSDFSSLNLPNKDASLILLVFAIFAYVNKHEILFLMLLVSFIIIYFVDSQKIKDFINPIFKFFPQELKVEEKKPEVKEKKVEEKKVEEKPKIKNMENTLDTENTNEFTIDDNIDE